MEKVSSGAENFSQTGKVGVPLNPTLVNYRAKLLGPTPRTDRFNGCNIIITARNNSCEKVMSSQNCQSLHRVGVGPSPLKGHTSLFQGHTSPGPYPPPRSTYGRRVGGTHPTGMLSCCKRVIFIFIKVSRK